MSKSSIPPSCPDRSSDRSLDRPFQIEFEGHNVSARPGDTVASALIAAGVQVLSRSPKFHRPRTAFCLSGVCGSCLMRIDGRPNTRACQVKAEPGLRCSRQNAWPSADYDVLAAADVMFPESMDHHTLMTSSRSLNQIMQKVVQRMGGLGRIPDEDTIADTVRAAICRHVDVLVVGGGPSGLRGATEIARSLGSTGKVVLVESQLEAGGSYLCHPELGRDSARSAVEQAEQAGVEILCATVAFGYFGEDRHTEQPPTRHGVLAAASEKSLYKLSAERYLYATGATPQNLLFGNNDRPGVLSGRAVGRLLACHGIRVGEKPLVVGQGEFPEALVRALRRNGQTVLSIDGSSETLIRSLGSTWVDGAEVRNERGVRTLQCDLIVIATPPAAASELLTQHGVPVRLHGLAGFVAVASPDGHTQLPNVYVCGEVTDSMSPRDAAQHGQRVGKTVADSLLSGFSSPKTSG
jgi:sarcosine oxidase subunit alpha